MVFDIESSASFERLKLANARVFLSSFDRANIRYRIVQKDDAKRQLHDFLDGHRDAAGIIYGMSRTQSSRYASIFSRPITHPARIATARPRPR